MIDYAVLGCKQAQFETLGNAKKVASPGKMSLLIFVKAVTPRRWLMWLKNWTGWALGDYRLIY
ncbi:MAG: hypothetical protein P5681_15800 [Limnospira sp. PMC 894.15]|uniref:Transposase n=1 Tax=Limnospira fusiformis PMC 851.14 TaxID=2219512 RepID=A0ABU9EN79_LIMFS|nr:MULTISPECIES: hypothetical protein [unclassified Limnospira]MDT9189277.1 hypothetical protein [Limnospira sp. PMC 894.15]MDT9235489.1 hypothetical protein [Limnospira sp. PMC 917.15]MDT9276316.1 hypothetical protein [Limnospira sp. PMC 737.11]